MLSIFPSERNAYCAHKAAGFEGQSIQQLGLFNSDNLHASVGPLWEPGASTPGGDCCCHGLPLLFSTAPGAPGPNWKTAPGMAWHVATSQDNWKELFELHQCYQNQKCPRACREVFITRLFSSKKVYCRGNFPPFDKRLSSGSANNCSCSASHLRAVSWLAKFLHHGSIIENIQSLLTLNWTPSHWRTPLEKSNSLAEISPSDLCTKSQCYNGGEIHLVLHFKRG